MIVAHRPPRESLAREFLAATRVAMMILSARFIMILGLIGAFVISIIAIQEPTVLKLVCVLLYCAGIFIPLVILCYRRGFPVNGD